MIVIADFNIAPIQLKDAWNICNFAVANEDRLSLYFPKTLEQNLTPTLSENFVQKKVKQFSSREEFLFTVKQKESNQLVGMIYIKELNWDTMQGEFAYAIGYSFEGKGLMSKAVKALSQYAFKTLQLKTLQIISNKNNIGSVKVAEKCNFKWIKTLPNGFTPTNQAPVDMELYELYNEG